MTEITEATKLRHICEVCDKDEILTVEQAFRAGWDYPPSMGEFGTISPRTCGDCGIDQTLWWKIAVAKTRLTLENYTEKEIELIQRINAEPESVLVRGGPGEDHHND